MAGEETPGTHARFDRWPLYLSHFPAAEISSVVHLPRIRSKHRKSSNSSLAFGSENASGAKCGSKGCSSSRRVDVGEMASGVEGTGSGIGCGRYEVLPAVKPSAGSFSPKGGSNLNGLPSESSSSSWRGSNESLPEKACRN
jgi:hypothetical protein